jgi:molybdate transport system regulatory protein
MKKSNLPSIKKNKTAYICKGLFWIEAGEELFFGKGRMLLLEGLLETGSVSQAAKSMGITYKHAIKFIDSMNSHVSKPLVLLDGGARSSIATVTAEGKKTMRLYKKYNAEFNRFLSRLEKDIDFS